MNDLKHIKRFNENSELSEESKSDLINLKKELQFVGKFDIEIHEAIKVIDELHKMNWEQIEEWRTHLITNYSTTKLEDFTLRLIDRYCSNIEG